MPIVQVTINHTCKVFALLDSGSSASFCTKDLVRQLGMKGWPTKLNLSTLNRSETQPTEIVDLSVSAESGDVLHMAGVYVIDNIPVQSTPVDTSSYSYFDGIGPLTAYDSDVTVQLLIGQDNAEAFVPLDVKRGKPGEPFAMRTLFGWCINGQSDVQKTSCRAVSNFVSVMPIDEQVSKLWEIENEGLDDCQAWSIEDKAVIDLWDREVKKVNGHFELPIPWKGRSQTLPNNFVVAKKRIDSLFKKFDHDADYCAKYSTEIDKLLEKNYAERVPADELFTTDRTWYLPHLGVTNDKKPDKLRVVFDCASKFHGESLNTRCLQGPDLVNNTLSVLLRFCQHSIAIQADIESMYHQVSIPPCDRDALRFLWYSDGKLEYYRMTSHLFGGVWCSASSTYALHRTVKGEPQVHPLVRKTVEESFYVDDCLASVMSVADAKVIIQQIPKTLQSAGFNLTKFVVNHRDLLSEIPEICRAKEVRDLSPDAESRALGVKWKVSTDEFFFEVQRDLSGPVTRRIMLSITTSIFDPLGLLGPTVLIGKLLFQEATARKIDWADDIPNDLLQQWRAWVTSLHGVRELRFPRCCKPQAFDDAAIQLHHFSDASAQGYGCCSYLRCVNKYGQVHVQLIMSKNKVAPLKTCTLPRLELQAAVLAVKVDGLLKRELELPVIQTFFWSDSEIVLKYINNESRRFHVFVANRISLIRQHTDPQQWHHIDGKSNPADLVTRSLPLAKFDMQKWLYGPAILHKYQSQWASPVTQAELSDTDPEVKSHAAVHTTVSQVADVAPENDPINRLMHHYSSWYRMKRALAWWIKFVDFCRGGHVACNLTVADISNAGKVLVRHSQKTIYGNEYGRLLSAMPVRNSSPLRNMYPYIDNDGLIRVGGRLRESELKCKHPYIISGDHVIAAAIVRDVHGMAHIGVEWVMSKIRREFWLIKGRRLVKRLIRNCVICKRLFAKPNTELMADLPAAHVEAGQPAFNCCGIDAFGPFYVKYGRAEIKRYGLVYTCMSTRAVHIEKLDTLETDSFLNSFRRFSCRRGQPNSIFSDQATTFISAEAQLSLGLLEVSKKVIDAYAVSKGIAWNFNPPTASHMGGAWERMIGMIRRIMDAILPRTVRLTD